MRDRRVLGVMGRTGYGKSVWTRQYVAGEKRLFVYDPLASYDVKYCDADELASMHDWGAFDRGRGFRVGLHKPEDVDVLGSIAMLAGDCKLVLEECSTILESRKPLPVWARNIVFLGRHQGVDLVAVAQRAASIPIDMRSQLHRVVTFAQSERDDTQWLKSWFPEDWDSLPMLPKLTALDSEDGEVSRYTVAIPAGGSAHNVPEGSQTWKS